MITRFSISADTSMLIVFSIPTTFFVPSTVFFTPTGPFLSTGPLMLVVQDITNHFFMKKSVIGANHIIEKLYMKKTL